MGGKSKSPPPAPAAPDPAKTVAAEASQNRVTTFRPDGSIAQEFGYIDNDTGAFIAGAPPGSDLPQAAVKTTETGFESDLRGIQEGTALGTAEALSGNVDALGSVPTYDPNGNEIATTIYNRSADLLREDMDRSNSRLQTTLQARGLAPGSAGYNNAVREAQRTENEAWSNLATDAVLAAQGEARADFSAEEAERANRIGELAPLLGGSYIQAGAQPIATSAPSLNVGGAYAQNYAGQMNDYNARLGAWQNQQSANNQLLATGASIGSALLFSDQRLKRNLTRIGRTPGGLGVYRFRYFWSAVWHVGVLAQEALALQPHAVKAAPNGYLVVNYEEIR